MSNTASAAARVFATAELLEAILLEADLQTVLLAQRVNCYFQACIQGSSKLQEKLFLKPLPSGSVIEWHKDKPQHNPLLLTTPEDSSTVQTGNYKHPRVKLDGLDGGFYLNHCEVGDEDEVLVVEFSDFNLESLRQTLAVQQSTFLDMYLYQTVSSSIQIRLWNDHPTLGCESPDTDWETVRVEARMGTLGQLLEIAMSMQQAAESLARVEDQRPYEERDRRMYGDIGPAEPSEGFNWKEHLGRQALEMLEDTPKLLLY